MLFPSVDWPAVVNTLQTVGLGALWMLLVLTLGYVFPKVRVIQLESNHKEFIFVCSFIGGVIIFFLLHAATPNGLFGWTALAVGTIGAAFHMMSLRESHQAERQD